jgi:transposase-like protein
MKATAPDTFSSLIELLDYFSTTKKCEEYIQVKRWGNSPICPHCEGEKIYKFSDGKRFKCGSCKKQFTVRIGTIFQDSNVPLRKWIIAMYLNTCHKKGISSYQLAKDIKVTQKTAWFMLQRIRYGLGHDTANEQLEGTVQVDETFVGGKNKNRHADKKVKNSQGRSESFPHLETFKTNSFQLNW